MGILLVIVGIVLLQLLILAHEYGHFIVAKRQGVKVREFGLGFPPRLWAKTMGKGIWRGYYSFNLLPLGGFVKLEGEADSDTRAGTYGSCSLWSKTKILLAGVFVNFVIAAVLFSILAFVGIPRLLPSPVAGIDEQQFSIASDTQILQHQVLIGYVEPDSPASAAGLLPDDQILALQAVNQASRPIQNVQELTQRTKELAGQKVVVTVKRQHQTVFLETTLRNFESNESQLDAPLGVFAADLVLQKNTWSAPITGIVLTGQFTKVILQSLGQTLASLLEGDVEPAKRSVSGPIGIYYVLQASAQRGLRALLTVVALLSLTLGVVNSLPIPALDGGRLALTVLFRKILRRPLTKKLEERIVFVSMAALIGLVILASWFDIQRFILSG